MLVLLKTRRWLGFTALVLVAIAAFGILSNWQWHRAEEKAAQRAALELAAAGSPIELTTLADTTADWQSVEAVGTYDPNTQVVVRQRPQEGRNGFWVLTQLDLADGRVAWVVRGWLPASSSATTSPEIPTAPTGSVSVMGTWHQFERVDDAARVGLPVQMVGAVDPEVLPAPGDFNGYLRVSSSTPPSPGLTVISRPQIDDSMNLSYAGQWLLFAGVALVGWFFFLRREAKEAPV